MANATICDCCGAAVKSENSYYAKIWHNNKHNETCAVITGFDMCPSCLMKLLVAIGKEDKYE